MKKIRVLPLALLTLFTFGLISSCGPKTDPSTSAPTTENISGVEIGGPSSVYVDKTIKLVADVVGSDDDSVNWSSSDNEVATIDSTGTLTGISEGEVTITAKSAAKPEYFATKVVTVTAERATGLKASIDENENVTKVNESVYNVALGVEVEINLSLNPANSKALDSVAVEVIGPSSIPTSQFVVEQNEHNIMTAKFVGYTEADGVVVKFKGTYIGNTTSPLITSVTLNVVDIQAENRAKISELVSENIENEASTLQSAAIVSTYKEGEYEEQKNYELVSYLDASYTHVKEFENHVPMNETSYYSGTFSTEKRSALNYYCFEYDPASEEITHLYANEIAKQNENRQMLFVENGSTGLTYGIFNKLANLIENIADPHLNIISLKDMHAFTNAKYQLSSDSYVIESNFDYPDTSLRYEIRLAISFNSDRQITYYSFEENVYDSNVLSYQYTEILDSVTYSTKTEHNSSLENHINIRDYFLESYVLEHCNDVSEHYDYSNTEKYGAQQIDIVDGITKYTVLKHKTLVLKVVNNGSNKNASLAIDRVEGHSSHPLVVENPLLTGNDIFAINPYKDPATDEITLGQATLTFVSSLGVEQKIIVEFVDSELLEVYTSLTPENNHFGEVFEGRYSDYFYINTDPDEDVYEYYLDVVEGDENGIELIRHSYDNIWGYPGFSYAIQGNKVGSYKFRIGVVGSFLTTADYYTIDIVEPYSVDYLKQHLVTNKPTFIYYTGTLQTDLTFISETQISLTTKMLGESATTSTINYRFEKGKIVVDQVQTLNPGMYFGDVKDGEIYFNKDLTSIILIMSMEGDSGEFKSYTHYEFKQKVTDVVNHINGKTYTDEFFVPGKGSVHGEISFKDGKGSFDATDLNGNLILSSTFDYSYDAAATSFNLTNIEYSYREKTTYSIDDEIYFHELYGRLEFKFYTNAYNSQKLTFSL